MTGNGKLFREISAGVCRFCRRNRDRCSMNMEVALARLCPPHPDVTADGILTKMGLEGQPNNRT